jgi:hypothetical protein
VGPLNGSADNEDAVELVGVKGQQANGNISRQLDNAVDGEVWEAGDSGSDDGHVMARLPCCMHPVQSAASPSYHLALLLLGIHHMIAALTVAMQEDVLLDTHGVPQSDDPRHLQDSSPAAADGYGR